MLNTGWPLFPSPVRRQSIRLFLDDEQPTVAQLFDRAAGHPSIRPHAWLLRAHHQFSLESGVFGRSPQRRGSISVGVIISTVLSISPTVRPTIREPATTAAKQPTPKIIPAAIRMELLDFSLLSSAAEII